MPLTVAPHGADPRALYAIAFGPLGDPVRLVGDPERLPVHQAGRTGLLFDLRHQFRLVESEPRNRRPEWRVSTVSYQYRVLDVRRRELLVWHWQPGEDFDGPDRPHLHVSAKLMANTSPHDDTQINEIDLDTLHLATGRVSIEAVVRTLIEDFHVAPRQPAKGQRWDQILDRAEATFRTEATQHP